MMKTLWRCTLLYPSTIRSFETIELKEMSNRISPIVKHIPMDWVV